MAKKKIPTPKYRVVSDGTIGGTRLYDQFGNIVGRVTKIKWEADVADTSTPTLTVEMFGIEIDAAGVPSITRRVDRTIS